MPDFRPFEARSSDHLRLVIDSGHIGIWELDLLTGHAVRNRAHDEIFGYDEVLPEWTYEQFLEHVAEHDRTRVDELQKAAIAKGSEWSFQCEIRTATGERRWISAAGRPLRGPDGAVTKLIGHVIDISDTKRKEAQLSLITDELNHRVRNMLAVIRSIIRLSASKAETLSSFAEALEGRVEALARSHNLLVADASSVMTPSSILKTELAAFSDLGKRVKLTVVDELAVTGATGQGLALILHELITNALKYGALSTDTGYVTVRITEGDAVLRVQWRETGGPRVQQDRPSGFGTTLIQSALGSAGTVEHRLAPAGVECDIELREF